MKTYVSQRSFRTKPLRVLVIAQYYPPDMGGGATRAYNAVRGLTLHGAEVTVVAAFPHYPHGNVPRQYRWKLLKIEYNEGVKIIRTFVPPLPSIGLAYRAVIFLSFALTSLLALPAVGRVDVIWAANPNIISFFPAVIYGLIKRAPIALNVDDLWPEDMYSLNLLNPKSTIAKIAETLARVAYHSAKVITPISPYYSLVICNRYHVPYNKVKTVRSGVDISKFRPCPAKTDCGKFIILYSGAFSIAYDFDQLLEAAKRLESENIEFIIQGGGELASHLRKKINEMKLHNVKLIERIMSREEIPMLLCQADALILPLREFGRPYLGISSKLYEYQAAGKPIICIARGAPALHVTMTNSGVIVKPSNIDELVEKIRNLANNRTYTLVLGSSGRNYVEKEASIEKIGLILKEILITITKN